jgi:Ca-activated chloride channel family protein
VVTNADEAAKCAERFREYISAPVLTDIQVRYEGFKAHETQPGKCRDLFADRPIEVIGKWTGTPGGRIVVTGKSGGAPYEAAFDVTAESLKGMQNAALRPLWARERVRELSSEHLVGSKLRQGNAAELQEEITSVGLTYDLLTEFTSFVGVDDTPRELLAQAQTVTQPIPLPQGVNNNAVGANQVVVTSSMPTQHIGSAPEPGVTGLLVLTAVALWMQRRRKW